MTILLTIASLFGVALLFGAACFHLLWLRLADDKRVTESQTLTNVCRSLDVIMAMAFVKAPELHRKWINRPRPYRWFNPEYNRGPGSMWVGRPGRHPDHFVTVPSLLCPEGNESTACLVGDYTEADRFLWVAVCMGFPSMVQMALDKGADAGRIFECRTTKGVSRNVDLLFLAFLKSRYDVTELHQSYLIGNDITCCDAALIWNVRVGDTFNDEEMDGQEVAELLVKAGANPFQWSVISDPVYFSTYPIKSAKQWQAASWVQKLGALYCERLMNTSLPAEIVSTQGTGP